ncbi:MAG: hypothetical protein E4G91_02255 [Candidatus Zixiibacteriota bacterium]|nr:MAG: hypothetical protein E4G91_02255 [candidate division Zixibacteria bacterium]
MKSLVTLLLILVPTFLFAAMPFTRSPVWQSTETGVYSTGLVWQDADRDGYLDMFVSNGNDMASAIEYIYQNNAGTIPTTHTWGSSAGDYSGHCAVGDINADGYPEYFVSNHIRDDWGATESKMFLNNGGIFGTIPSWTTGDTLHSFACELGDVDGDGDLDIAFTAGEGYGHVAERQRIYFNNDGTIGALPGWQSHDASYMLDLSWADFDNDGDLDLAFCGDEGHVWLYRNTNYTLDTLPSWQSADVNPGNTLAWGDMDGDGWLDLAVADNNQTGGNGRFKVYQNNGGLLTTSPVWQSATGGYGSSVCWYDFDRDGDNDLATGRWWNVVAIYENVGGVLTTAPVWQSSTSTVIEEIRMCDVDRDGVESYRTARAGNGYKKAFYVDKYPMHSLDSLLADGTKLTLAQYCYDLNSGWASLATAPLDSVILFYQYSDKQDLAVVNWDGANLIFADTLTHTPTHYVKGDADGSGAVDISDVVFLISYIFSGGSAPNPLFLGDADCSGSIDISDAVYLISYIFSGGAAPC